MISSASHPWLSRTLVEESDAAAQEAAPDLRIDTAPIDPLTVPDRLAIRLDDLPGRG
ncbi:MAG: hypothetical protein PHT97_13840 [Methanoculleus sp.]|jgi:hypothetical protein|uniref:hypothetical protein n=1 Tax=Methanoculleus sp. TaxID=90427 RepID=UPI00262C7C1C|nr:hypothetical protein [Methanoculleus sp.]MDD2255400.1 hypothetical protein [Methanoculleus sp.]MDD4472224.1 hypothetical protein [Methanoculleus sp.]